ncbi:MAG: hypothetical protein KAT68_17890 [Bacteroidales bacterium]|nr:hypothetical protein [Bacteroidales bacterium]
MIVKPKNFELKKPLLFMVFNRPEKTKRVWEQIRKAKPQKLYISADGPRSHLPDDKEKCEKVREIVSIVDWNCDVKYLLHYNNLGCTMAGKTAFDWIWSQEDEMIQLEDDVIPTQGFFWFMQEMLDKYKDDKRICYVCAENYGNKSGNATYFFSQYGGSWGWATWKRVYDLWEYKLDSLEETVNTKRFINTFPSKFQYKFWKRRFEAWKYVGGNTYDLQTIYLIHKQNLLNIVPNINLVTNIGWDSEASNTVSLTSDDPETIKFGNIKSFEINEIIHPTEVKSDRSFDTKWFKYHFKNKSELEYRLRWFLGPYYRKLFPKKS